jgi:HNH endonuclease
MPRRPPPPAHHGGVAQLDRADRLTAILERDGRTCIWCGRSFGALIRPTTEHVVPRVKGGPSWPENEVAACHRCNAARGHTGPVQWLAECRGRGWAPDEPRLTRALEALAGAIAVRGGQRRARPYLDAQLRRLHRQRAAAPAAGPTARG